MSTTDIDLVAAKHAYWKNGYTVLRGIFSEADTLSWRLECQRLWETPGILDDLNLRSEFRLDINGNYMVDRLDPVLDISPVLRAAVLDNRLTAPLSYILGGPSSLLKCKLIRKEPGTKGYAVHQDFFYWRWLDIKPNNLCSIGISVYPSNKQSGGIEFFPSCHTSLLPGADEDPDSDCDVALLNESVAEVPELDYGDVVIFHSLTPHRSGPNLSGYPRTLLLPSFAVANGKNLYAEYYARELRRRCVEHAGFERYDETVNRLFSNATPAS